MEIHATPPASVHQRVSLLQPQLARRRADPGGTRYRGDPRKQPAWCLRFGVDFARRPRRLKPGDTWHLDELFIRIRGMLHYLWRAVDQHGVVLDILVQDRRNGAAAKRFFKRLRHGLKYKPRLLITDGLRSYGALTRAVLPDVGHPPSRCLNNRAENSHRPTRRRERQMQRFKSPGQAQQFLPTHAMIYGHFRPRRHLMVAAGYRCARTHAFRIWRQETCVRQAACHLAFAQPLTTRVSASVSLPRPCRDSADRNGQPIGVRCLIEGLSWRIGNRSRSHRARWQPSAGRSRGLTLLPAGLL